MKIHMNIADPKATVGQLEVGEGFINGQNTDVYLVMDVKTLDRDQQETVRCLRLNTLSVNEIPQNTQVQRVNVDIHVTEYVRRERRKNVR